MEIKSSSGKESLLLILLLISLLSKIPSTRDYTTQDRDTLNNNIQDVIAVEDSTLPDDGQDPDTDAASVANTTSPLPTDDDRAQPSSSTSADLPRADSLSKTTDSPSHGSDYPRVDWSSSSPLRKEERLVERVLRKRETDEDQVVIWKPFLVALRTSSRLRVEVNVFPLGRSRKNRLGPAVRRTAFPVFSRTLGDATWPKLARLGI